MKASDPPVAYAFLRAVSPFVATSSPVVAHALSVPRQDSSRRLGRVPLRGLAHQTLTDSSSGMRADIDLRLHVLPAGSQER